MFELYRVLLCHLALKQYQTFGKRDDAILARGQDSCTPVIQRRHNGSVRRGEDFTSVCPPVMTRCSKMSWNWLQTAENNLCSVSREGNKTLRVSLYPFSFSSSSSSGFFLLLLLLLLFFVCLFVFVFCFVLFCFCFGITLTRARTHTHIPV